MAETIKDRLKQLAQNKGLSIRSFEEKCGLGRGNISNMSQYGSIGSDKLSKIFDTFPDTNLYWLLSGEGEMDTKENRGEIALQTENPKEGIPLIPAEAVAGIFAGEIPVSPDEYQYYYVPVFKNASYLLPIKGDSMMPTYQSGDIVACQLLPLNDIFFQWGKTYIVDTEQGALIKRVFQGSTNDKLKLVSDNAKYPPFEIPLNTIYHIALVLGIIRAE